GPSPRTGSCDLLQRTGTPRESSLRHRAPTQARAPRSSRTPPHEHSCVLDGPCSSVLHSNYTGGIAVSQSRLPIRRRDNVVDKQPAFMRPAPGSVRAEQDTITFEPGEWYSPGDLNLINLPNNLAQVQSPETAARFVETYGPLLYHYE